MHRLHRQRHPDAGELSTIATNPDSIMRSESDIQCFRVCIYQPTQPSHTRPHSEQLARALGSDPLAQVLEAHISESARQSGSQQRGNNLPESRDRKITLIANRTTDTSCSGFVHKYDSSISKKSRTQNGRRRKSSMARHLTRRLIWLRASYRCAQPRAYLMDQPRTTHRS